MILRYLWDGAPVVKLYRDKWHARYGEGGIIGKESGDEGFY